MKLEPTDLPDVLVIEPERHGDERGFFQETWNRERYAEIGIDAEFVQDNVSLSACNVVRGLHLQHPKPQGKLIWVLRGEVFDVAVDVRVGSPGFGRWTAELLSDTNGRQLWVPEGFAHGFCVVSETALFAYKCTGYYDPEAEIAVQWNDPAIGIDWPVSDPVLSRRDAEAQPLAAWDAARLPAYSGAS